MKKEILNSYPFFCPSCNSIQEGKPSIAMKEGMNTGHSACYKCGVLLHLEINEDNSYMIAQKIDSDIHLTKDLLIENPV